MQAANFGWVLASGIVSVLLGATVLAGWPVSGLWAIGLFVGIEMFVYGMSQVMPGNRAPRSGARARPPGGSLGRAAAEAASQAGPGATVDAQWPSTKYASPGPGHGGIVTPTAARGSVPNDLN